MNVRVLGRKAHRWMAVIAAGPFLVVIVSGLLLQLKKEIPWVQPPTAKGSAKEPGVSFDAVLAAVKGVPEAEVGGWADIDRLDIRPKDGTVKVQCKSRYEVQLDARTGAVLQVAYRRSDVIESLHDGSWFGDPVKLYVFLPAAALVLGLWVTGAYLYVLPLAVKWRRKAPKMPAPTQEPT